MESMTLLVLEDKINLTESQTMMLCGHVVSYWRHYGTHWVFYQQWTRGVEIVYFGVKILLQREKERKNYLYRTGTLF